MRRVKNLIENKDLINTFKKFKTRIHLNKNSFRQNSFFFSKYTNVYFSKKQGLGFCLRKCIFTKKYTPDKELPNLDLHICKFFKFKTILMFI